MTDCHQQNERSNKHIKYFNELLRKIDPYIGLVYTAHLSKHYV